MNEQRENCGGRWSPGRTPCGPRTRGIGWSFLQWRWRSFNTWTEFASASRSSKFSTICKFTESDTGWILSIFALSYAVFEIPSGWLGDRFGPRKALIRVVLWWSFFTILTGWMNGFWSMLIVRFLFGAGEAGCFPNLTRAFVNWLQPAERVRAQSILWFSARLGGAVTPIPRFLRVELSEGRRGGTSLALFVPGFRYSGTGVGAPFCTLVSRQSEGSSGRQRGRKRTACAEREICDEPRQSAVEACSSSRSPRGCCGRNIFSSATSGTFMSPDFPNI